MRLAISLLFVLVPFLVISQFPNLMWEYPTGAPAFGSGAAADLDDDGFYEIVFTTYTNDGRAHCLNAEDGSVHWIYDIGGCGDVAPIIADVNNDGLLEVVINGSCNPTIFCLRGDTGELLWSKPSGGGDSPPTIADIDGDQMPEILFGNFSGEIRILNGEDGSTAKIIPADPFGNAIQTEPTLADVNGDQKLDIIAANFFNENGLYVWAFDYASGEILWTNSMTNPDADFHAYHGGAVADIDNDQQLEYVIGSGGGTVTALNIEDGSELWQLEIAASNMSAISIADLDEDGTLEVIFNNNDYITFDERIWVVSGLDGTVEWSYPITFSSFRGMSISDINGNGKLDLVSGHFMGNLRVVEPYSGPIWEENLINYFPAGLPWFEVDHGPLIADFDQNGTLDVFAVAGYGTYTPDSLNTGSAFMFEAGEGTCPEWLMFRQDEYRSGYLSVEEIENSCNVTSVATPKLLIPHLEVNPNPNNGVFNVQFTLTEDASVKMELSDMTGKSCWQSLNRQFLAGTHQWEVGPAEIATGVYLCTLQIGQQKVYRKVVVQR